MQPAQAGADSPPTGGALRHLTARDQGGIRKNEIIGACDGGDPVKHALEQAAELAEATDGTYSHQSAIRPRRSGGSPKRAETLIRATMPGARGDETVSDAALQAAIDLIEVPVPATKTPADSNMCGPGLHP